MNAQTSVLVYIGLEDTEAPSGVRYPCGNTGYRRIRPPYPPSVERAMAILDAATPGEVWRKPQLQSYVSGVGALSFSLADERYKIYRLDKAITEKT